MSVQKKASPKKPRRKGAFRSLRLTCTYVHGSDGWWFAEALGARGVATQGRTLRSARENLREVIELPLEDAPQQLPDRAKPAPDEPGTISEFVWAVVPR